MPQTYSFSIQYANVSCLVRFHPLTQNICHWTRMWKLKMHAERKSKMCMERKSKMCMERKSKMCMERKSKMHTERKLKIIKALTGMTKFPVQMTQLAWVKRQPRQFQPACCLLMHSMHHIFMLTLDPTTLFYWNLSETHHPSLQHRPLINKWASGIPGPENARPPTIRTISSQPQPDPGLTRTMTMTTFTSAPLSSQSALMANVGIQCHNDNENVVGGLSDHDKTKGPEWAKCHRIPKQVRHRICVMSEVGFSTLSCLEQWRSFLCSRW